MGGMPFIGDLEKGLYKAVHHRYGEKMVEIKVGIHDNIGRYFVKNS